MSTRHCHICGTLCQPGEACVLCVERFPGRRPAATMPPEERQAELRLFEGPMEMPFDLIHQRIEELVGRPVFTHEMGVNWEGLVAEAGSWAHPTMGQIIELVPTDKRIVVEVP